jgi:hypothetical protein
MTDHHSMDSPSSNPSPPNTTTLSSATPPQLQSTPQVSQIESHFPTADANQLLELIAQGHDPANLNGLINHTYNQPTNRAA